MRSGVASMTEAFWQPWQPKVGDRVRIQVSGECQNHHLGNWHASDGRTLIQALKDGDIGGPGYQGANGAIGTVIHICIPDDGEEDDGHPYYVNDCDGKRHWDRVDDFFAAIELEPVEVVQAEDESQLEAMQHDA